MFEAIALIAAPGCENFEVALSHRLDIRCDDQDYTALWLENDILGATFHSRLVTAVREEQGLTYSIRSQLAKPCREFDGHWQIDLSLSPDKCELRRTIATTAHVCQPDRSPLPCRS